MEDRTEGKKEGIVKRKEGGIENEGKDGRMDGR